MTLALATLALIATIFGFFAAIHFAGEAPKCPVDRRARVGRGSSVEPRRGSTDAR